MNCLIHFGKHTNFSFLDSKEVLNIVDSDLVQKILNLGFTRNDVQSLFQIKDIVYLTSDNVYFRENEYISTEFFNKKDAIQLVNELCKLHDFTITDDYNVFDFSFPKIEFERYINNNFDKNKTIL